MVTQQFDPRYVDISLFREPDITSMSYIKEVKMDQFVLQTTADISLFHEPDIVVHHHKHELYHGSQHGSVCPTNNC